MKPILAVPATLALVYRAYSRKSLTPAGIVAAALTAVAHAVHPWNLPFVLLAVFFLAGTRATHVKKEAKAHLTQSASGPSGGEGPRTHVQVLANSLVASVLSLLHTYQLHARQRAARLGDDTSAGAGGSLCFAWRGDLLVVGLVAHYAVVAADTFSSELGILSRATPRLITSLTLRKVPRGTNGGVTLAGLAAGLLGSVVVVTAAMLFLPLCGAPGVPAAAAGLAAGPQAAWSPPQRRLLMAFLAVWGLLGSLLDSVLGGLFQRTVRDVRSGKVVEGDGGLRVLLAGPPPTSGGAETAATGTAAGTAATTSDGQPTRVVENGWDLLDNNDVNFLTAATMSLGAMAVASWYWGVPLGSILGA